MGQEQAEGAAGVSGRGQRQSRTHISGHPGVAGPRWAAMGSVFVRQGLPSQDGLSGPVLFALSSVGSLCRAQRACWVPGEHTGSVKIVPGRQLNSVISDHPLTNLVLCPKSLEEVVLLPLK